VHISSVSPSHRHAVIAYTPGSMRSRLAAGHGMLIVYAAHRPGPWWRRGQERRQTGDGRHAEGLLLVTMTAVAAAPALPASQQLHCFNMHGKSGPAKNSVTLILYTRCMIMYHMLAA
jgi:hypothetical protein